MIRRLRGSLSITPPLRSIDGDRLAFAFHRTVDQAFERIFALFLGGKDVILFRRAEIAVPSRYH